MRDGSKVLSAAQDLEITQFCQLKCAHCYSESGPHGGRGTMTPDDWERLIGQAAALGVETVQFIGGEPTLDPDLPRLVRYALGAGVKVDIYTSLVHVTAQLWELFSLPGVSVGFSWYSADPRKHAEVGGLTRPRHRRALGRVRGHVILAVPGQARVPSLRLPLTAAASLASFCRSDLRSCSALATATRLRAASRPESVPRSMVPSASANRTPALSTPAEYHV